MTQIANDMIVEIHYTLRDDENNVIDSSVGDQPLVYLHGHQNIVPGLERELTGKAKGDKVQVRVEAADGYGERKGPGPQTISTEAFPPDVTLVPGMQFMAPMPDGSGHVPVWITGVDEASVTIDFDHPLAGQNLNFEVEIMRMRDAHENELTHGHAHGFEGDGGHHH